MISTPYPWPWHGSLDPRRLALLAVTCPSPPGGPSAAAAGEVAGQVAGAVRKAGGLVVRVRVRPPLSPSAGLTAAAPFGDPAAVEDGGDAADLEARAAGWDGFHGCPLDELLRAAGRDLLLLSGCCLELGVHSTMRSANDRGYECLLLSDACAVADASLGRAALSMIEMSGGIFGAVGSSTALLRELS
ncbi:isochorismatase family protein [Microbispora sp. ATCC PTA-5024]|uniref:isochorismatase family protein n=1 Tax=Microbispora sp. ATCC PTA-5024 TaxID=316330 RepID=UPI0003DBE3CF|nr:isochorismatase family protein [Microbispora sp. ATCC PTA-5024]ETK33732.1 hypothetical protein MPTA5024_23015 [Microbispora sp. ATCC PTA-5024]